MPIYDEILDNIKKKYLCTRLSVSALWLNEVTHTSAAAHFFEINILSDTFDLEVSQKTPIFAALKKTLGSYNG